MAFVTQSGALLTAVLDWANARGIGFSHLLSLGGMADVDFGDMLDYLASDESTRAILLVRRSDHARAQIHVGGARGSARQTGDRLQVGPARRRCARGALAQRRAGRHRCRVRRRVPPRRHAACVCAGGPVRRGRDARAWPAHRVGDRLAIVTNGGGIGILATDRLIDEAGHLAELTPAVDRAKLDALLPPAWSHGNPVDIIGDADAERYRAALDIVIADPSVDATLVLNCPVAVASSVDCARRVVDAYARHRSKPLLDELGRRRSPD